MTTGARARCGLMAVLFLVAMGWGRQGAAATLGPHHLLYPNNPCKTCHDVAWGTPNLHGYVSPPWDPPGALSPWLYRWKFAVCIVCHRWGGAAGASPMNRLAYGAGAHGFALDGRHTPGSWLQDTPQKEDYSATGFPLTRGELECWTCHNVHTAENRPFNRSPDIESLCLACHAGRDNKGEVGERNRSSSGGESYSTHPTGVTVTDLPGNGITHFGAVDERLTVTVVSSEWKEPWVLGGHLADPASGDALSTPFTCQTCHVVHGTADRPGEHYPGLLAIWEKDNPSALCLGCHMTEHVEVAFADGRTVRHPMLDDNGTDFYPASFASRGGIPPAWMEEKHFDSGATPFDPQREESPFCTSCHDLHGGMPGTSILFGPNTVEGGKGDWCYGCHPAQAFEEYPR